MILPRREREARRRRPPRPNPNLLRGKSYSGSTNVPLPRSSCLTTGDHVSGRVPLRLTARPRHFPVADARRDERQHESDAYLQALSEASDDVEERRGRAGLGRSDGTIGRDEENPAGNLVEQRPAGGLVRETDGGEALEALLVVSVVVLIAIGGDVISWSEGGGVLKGAGSESPSPRCEFTLCRRCARMSGDQCQPGGPERLRGNIRSPRTSRSASSSRRPGSSRHNHCLCGRKGRC